MPDFLLELFSEEIPARMQARAAADLKKLVTDGLVEAGLTYAGAGTFTTPRRLVLTVESLTAESPTVTEERKGPRADAPEKALEGFLRSTGLTKDQLELRDDKKGQTYFASITKPGRAAADIIAEVIPATIRNFPWPKSMRWGSGSLKWVRPLHSILCILSDENGSSVVPFDIDGIASGDTTQGHRFMAPGSISVTSFDDYATKLKRAHVVLSARLADAKFFWENDLRVATSDMTAWTKALENVTFHNKLGTQAARIDRIAALARELAPMVGADADDAEQAARIAKADLSSEMVYEFPELQGLMGRYYALEAGFSKDIAAACQEHYSPLGPSDDVPTGPVSVAVALADKLDTLTGFWAIDEKPTGSKDPFALRRAALGVIRLVLTNALRLPLDRFIDAQLVRNKGAIIGDLSDETVLALLEEIAAHGVFGAAFRAVKNKISDDGNAAFDDLETAVPDQSVDLLSFLHDRLKNHLKDKNIRHDVIDACLAMPNNDDLTLLVKRAEALSAFLQSDDGENLVQGYKRAANILAQAEEKDGVEYRYGADAKFAETDEERALFSALNTAANTVTPALETDDFAAAMTALAGLRAPIDAFFEAVQVNADSQVLRRNRLNLLHEITAACAKIADLSKIEG